jgi:hypothetical protein
MKRAARIGAALTIAVAGCRLSQKTQVTAPSPIRFVDRAASAGITTRAGHGGRSPLTILDTAGVGCALLDFDGDGRLDILLVGSSHLTLYRNLGDGRFADVSTQTGIGAVTGTLLGCAVGDIDNDGFPEIFLTGLGKNALLHNDRGRRFTERTGALAAPSLSAWATSAAFEDLDGDGHLDLVVGHYVTFTPRSPQTCSVAGVPAACPPFHYPPQKTRVFKGDGNGAFVDATQAWGFAAGNGNNLGVAAADCDGDGTVAVYVANDGVAGDLWRRVGGRFRNDGSASGTGYNGAGATQAGMGVDWGDFDNDGRLDLVVSTFQDEPTALYHNEGSGLFRFASTTAGIAVRTRQSLGFGVILADFDGDGWLDLFTANGHVQDTIAQIRPPLTYRQPSLCLRNVEGVFEDVSAASGPDVLRPIVGRGIAVGDIDDDGRPDLLVVDAEGAPLLLHNESERPSSWVGLRLRGTRSNRQALGATVTFSIDGRPRLFGVRTGRGYLSASDPRVLIPLPAKATLSELTVRWPGRRAERFVVGQRGRYVDLVEGTGR